MKYHWKKTLMAYACIILGLQLLTYASAFTPTEASCESILIPYKESLSSCTEDSLNLTSDLSYYKNLSSYYQDLYEGKEINVTNREIIILNQQVNNLNMTINDIKNELSFMKLTLKVTIPIFSFTLLSLWGFSIYLRKKLRKK